ncbi:MAG: glycoside hydrolase family 9 protein [Bacteroidales bacterium]|jgi:endoglucanase|nr:glycoside hydrolase family 9 protein [Bacteroidales bacterium]
MKKAQILSIAFAASILFGTSISAQQKLELNDKGYLHMQGLDVTFFSDFYPDGHQSGVTIIMHGNRIAANGDIRLEVSPGQWSAIPTGDDVVINKESETLSKKLSFPDPKKNRIGFNPIIYPDLEFDYSIRIQPAGGSSFTVTIDLDEPLPAEWIGKVGFNLELFPGDLYGKSWIMDEKSGLFNLQASGDLEISDTVYVSKALATGKKLVIAPEDQKKRIVIDANGQDLELRDGRTNHNNGWFIVRSTVTANATKGAIELTITPNVVEDWKYEPVIQVSQLGYHPNQSKIAVIELDNMEENISEYSLQKVGANGSTVVKSGKALEWGTFLRYKYATVDFSDIKEPGVYTLSYSGKTSHPFQITEKVFNENTWQPTLEYFLPVQMCHMRVNEKYRVWHDICHMDDALMAPTNLNHFDGYKQGESTLTEYKAGDAVPGLNVGGWHDAGDYDLRVESQAGTVKMLAWMVEEFDLEWDATLIDQEKKLVEIHQPDGKSDVLQQIEHGLFTILGGYHSLGRLYRGIICQDLRQYVMLGDATSMTDNLIYDPTLAEDERTANSSGVDDDRWVFTEENPSRLLQVIPGLAAASRVMKDYNPELAEDALEVALLLWEDTKGKKTRPDAQLAALSELILATGDQKLINELISMEDVILKNIGRYGVALGRVIHKIDNRSFKNHISAAVAEYQADLKRQQNEDSPYGVPYKPNIWGAGWSIQSYGVNQYFFHKGWPELTPTANFENALHFVLGVHPGINNASFASGVGSNSVTTAYGVNRADWSFIPGGVASGTALIRPDLPELKEWPFFWQQTEYVMGGGATNYMFLVLAVNDLYK